MATIPDDNEAFRFPVSVKGIVVRDGRVILLKNERDEWELPGGKLEPSESPEKCVAREIREELQLDVEPTRLLDAWVYTIRDNVRVLIITYGCTEIRQHSAVRSHEHTDLQWVPLDEVAHLRMPEGYKHSVRAWTRQME